MSTMKKFPSLLTLVASVAALPTSSLAQTTVPALDERGPGGGASTSTVPTWDLRDIFLKLHERFPGKTPFEAPFPLHSTRLGINEAGTQVLSFEVAASAGRYLELAATGRTPPTELRLTTESGAQLPADARLTLVRTR